MTASHKEKKSFYRQVGLWTDERIGQALTSAAYRWADRELIYIGDRRYSYGEIARWTTAAARHLVDTGIHPGDRVLLHLGNCLELIVLQLAVWRIGAVSVPVVPIYRGHELRHILGDSRPRAIVTMSRLSDRRPPDEFDAMLAEAGQVPLLKIAVGEPAPSGWSTPCPQPDSSEVLSEAGLPDPAPADEVSLVLYTSGTTSAPKGAMLTGRALLSNADNWRQSLDLSASDVAFSGAPLAHIAALCSAFLAPIRCGGRTVIMASWKPDRAVELIAQEGVTYMAGATVFLQELVERCEAGMSIGARLMFMSGGAATAPSLIERADKVGITGVRCYGMTETAGTCTLGSRTAPVHKRAMFDGRVVFGTEFRIVDDIGDDLPAGQQGHVLIRSPQMMQGYTDALVSATQLDDQGWFKTGDVGLVDEDGWFVMSGRTKDIINRGGEKFSSADIESALLSHPEIASAAVLGAPHPRFGETVAAFLVLRTGATWVGPDGIIAHLEMRQLARAKIPAIWTVLDQLPTTATGKVQKQKLVSLLTEQSSPAA